MEDRNGDEGNLRKTFLFNDKDPQIPGTTGSFETTVQRETT